MDLSDISKIIFGDQYAVAIIPTVLIPLTGITVLITSLASIIAGWFGLKLKTEGPRQLWEALFSKKVVIVAVIMNAVIWGAWKSGVYLSNAPVFLWKIERASNENALRSDETYVDVAGRIHQFMSVVDTTSSTLKLSEKWKVKLPSGSFRSGALSGNSYFVSSDDGHVYELSRKDGKIKRKFFGGTSVTTRPVIHKQTLFFGEGTHDTHHARIYAFDLLSGKFINHFSTKGHTEGGAVLYQENDLSLLIFPAGKDGLYAVDPSTMQKVWHAQIGHTDTSVTIADKTIYTGTGKEKGKNDDKTFAFAFTPDGKMKWKTELPLSNWMHPVVSDKLVCYSLGEIYFHSELGFLYCLNKHDGSLAFSIPFSEPLTGKPLLINNRHVYVGSILGKVCRVDLQLKEMNWCVKTGNDKTSHSFSSPTYDEKRHVIWYASKDNGLFAINPEKGSVLLKWKSPDDWKVTYAAVTVSGDELYLQDMNGYYRRLDLL